MAALHLRLQFSVFEKGQIMKLNAGFGEQRLSSPELAARRRFAANPPFEISNDSSRTCLWEL